MEPIDSIGEVTARLLRLNMAERVVRRSILQKVRRYPRQNRGPNPDLVISDRGACAIDKLTASRSS